MENMAANFVTAMFLTSEGHDHRGRKLMDLLTLDDSPSKQRGAMPEMQNGRAGPGHFSSDDINGSYEHPLVEPQVSHLRQVPLRTIV
jgi:hypothetical protein